MSRGYIRFSWITLVLIFLVIAAGSIVRTTGSGMGCPDWPKCFDQIIPPTSEDQLPANYKETYSEYRKNKIEKFANLIAAIGFEEEAQELRTDPSLLVEEDFNAARTWTEYGNRLVGFLAGNAVLILFIWTFIRYRNRRKLLLLTFLNLILMGFEGWLGSIVVATNLVPWTITLHMFFALIIVGIHIKIIRIAKDRSFQIKIKPVFKYLFYFSLVLTFIQIIFGAQVRQEIDFKVIEGVDRAQRIDELTGYFLFHRSFSWLLLATNVLLLWMNKKAAYGIPGLKIIVGLILLLFITGLLFSYAGMPAILQPIHLLVAGIILGIQFYSLDYFKYKRDSMLR
ncbi:MAG: cytochrome c oxidase assembly protein subunit 15 [Crocinitomix sp.]|jgi:cytochrome c oxidase assembly protein subunit 15